MSFWDLILGFLLSVTTHQEKTLRKKVPSAEFLHPSVRHRLSLLLSLSEEESYLPENQDAWVYITENVFIGSHV